ncbi:MAG: oligosaccharide flippase family protein [Candidatus Krumholzibacteriota bacterium]|nr:oligosaccharide flippase family protein [Candidatus Krumholzibacteriota bacterium]
MHVNGAESRGAGLIPLLRASLRSGRGRIAVTLSVLNYLQAGLGFLINLSLANVLGAHHYGIFSLGLVVAGFVTALVGFASERTLVRDLVQSQDRDGVFSASVVLRSLLGLAVLAGVAAFLRWTEPADERFLPLLLCSGAGVLFGLSPTAWFDARYRMHLHAAIALGEKVLYGLALVLAWRAAQGAPTAAGAAVCLLGSRGVGLLVQWLAALRSYRPSFGRLGAHLRWLVSENWLIVAAGLSSLLYTHFNQIVLDRQHGASELAYYAVGFQLIAIVQLFQAQFVRVLDPGIAASTREGEPVAALRRQLRRFAGLSALGSAVIALPLLILAPWIIALFFQPEYQASVAPLRLLCLWSLVYGPALVVNRYLINLRLQRDYFIITLGIGLLAVVLGQALVPRFGGLGVVLSLLLSHPLSMALQFARVRARIDSLAARGVFR